MKANLMPANAKARAMLKKLQALAERGIDGEKLAAQRKLARLKARFDFTAADPTETPDLFQGSFKPATKTIVICSFGLYEFDIANAVKWAIESTTKIPCAHRGDDLLAEATPGTAKRLAEIAKHIARSFRVLLKEFSMVNGVSMSDRSAFVRGLFDGMMHEGRSVGQRLPGQVVRAKKPKGKKPRVTPATGLHIHPYTVALSLGKQIRFSVPLDRIAAELEAATQKCLTGKPL
jgi:hypothetical protein